MSNEIHAEEEFHMGEAGGVEEDFHSGGGESESFHLGSDEGESFHLGGDEGESFRLGGEDALEYVISEDGHSIIINAVDSAMDVVQDFVQEKLMAYGCEKKPMMQIRLAVEEIFLNIISYAYRPEIGKAEVFCEVSENPLSVCIQFMDSGKPFDPLARDEVDTSGVMFMEREGGFGIHLVKHTMDAVEYEYREGKNILTVHKLL